MTCEELKEVYELYAMGAADPSERRELEEHLARNCPVCVPGVRRAREFVPVLAMAVPQVEPPRRLRERVLALAGPAAPVPTGVSWLAHAWATVALLLLIAVIWFANANRKTNADIASLDRRLAEAKTANAELAARNRLLTNALALVNLPESRQLVFGTPDREPPRGRIWVHPQRGVLLLASRLPAAPTGKTYEMWIVPKQAPPVAAGLFNSDERGEATHVWTQPVELDTVGAIAVTLEPEGGVPAPTSQPIIAVQLGD